MTGRNPDLPHASPDRRPPRRAPLPAAPQKVEMGKSHDRHAAITGSLTSWTNYKRWAENIRNTWGGTEKP